MSPLDQDPSFANHKMSTQKAWKETWSRRLSLMRAKANMMVLPTPHRILFSPLDLATIDPIAGEDIAAGRFVMAGQSVEVGRESPFAALSPSENWSKILHSFVWLRHLRGVETATARMTAQRLVHAWLTQENHHPDAAFSTHTTARRVLAWLCHSSMILEGADRNLSQAIMRTLSREGLRLSSEADNRNNEATSLLAMIASISVSLAVQGLETRLPTQILHFESLLKKQMAKDGGHLSRNPSISLDVLSLLHPLRQSFVLKGMPVPEFIDQAIDAMSHFLNFMRLPDGALARFHGTGATANDLISSTLTHRHSAKAQTGILHESGYARLETQNLCLIADVSGAPALPNAAYTSPPLSFELIEDTTPILVNSGTRYAGLLIAQPNPDPMGLCALLPAKHGKIVPNAHTVKSSLRHEDNELILEANHDAFLNSNGFIHHRIWKLAHGGRLLEVEDKLVSPSKSFKSLRVEVRLLLHPRVEPDIKSRSVSIAMPNGGRWKVEALGAEMTLEPSLFRAVPEGQRSTFCLVLSTELSPDEPFWWTLKKLK